MNDRVGQQIGQYRIVRLLGQGGFAEVYLGEHIYLNTQAALKLLHGRFSAQDVKAFLHEAKTIAELKHPHIVRVYDFNLDQQMPYIVMDYAPNGTLHDRHPRGTMVPLPQILSYVRQVGAALAYTHERKLIHRDVKPENMLLDEQNQILLSDFGVVAIAHRTESMQMQNITGTVRYMAPEQFLGLSTPASDQYSLGILVYEWLCGESPFQGASFIEIGMKHATAPVPSLRQKVPTLMPEVEQVVLKAIAKDQKHRFLHIQDFVQALEQAVQSSSSATTFLPPKKVLQPSQVLPAPDASPLLPTQALEPTLPASPFLSLLLDQQKQTARDMINGAPARQEGSLEAHQSQKRNDRALVKELQKRVPNWDPDQRCSYNSGRKRCEYDQQGRVIELHLCELGLLAVPFEVCELSSLQELYFTKNQLTSLPTKLGQLTSLHTLIVSQNQLTTLPAELGQLTALRMLDLGNNQLISLPAELGQLTALRMLDLGNNQLISLPAELGRLTSLQWLNLMRNKFTSVPSGVWQCTALQNLYLAENQITQLPPELGQLTSLQTLTLWSNQLTALPAEIGKLSKLKELRVSDNQLTSLPPELGQLSTLSFLKLEDNPLHTLPPAIIAQGTTAILAYLRTFPQYLNNSVFHREISPDEAIVRKLQQRVPNWDPYQQCSYDSGKRCEYDQQGRVIKLHLCWLELSKIPPEVFELSSLQELHLPWNQLTSLPAQLGQLTSLRTLSVKRNQLTSLPMELRQLPSLYTLDLSENQFSPVPSIVWQLVTLQKLDLAECQLTSLPAELGRLTALRKLDLGINQLTSLPTELGRLILLQKLNLMRNKFTSVPPVVWQCTSLQELNVYNNRLTRLPPKLGQLTSLQRLDLRNNQLTALPAEIGKLSGLRSLWVQHNQLTFLPPELGQLSSLNSLELQGNPLHTPSSAIIEQGTKAILAYLRDLPQ